MTMMKTPEVRMSISVSVAMGNTMINRNVDVGVRDKSSTSDPELFLIGVDELRDQIHDMLAVVQQRMEEVAK